MPDGSEGYYQWVPHDAPAPAAHATPATGARLEAETAQTARPLLPPLPAGRAAPKPPPRATAPPLRAGWRKELHLGLLQVSAAELAQARPAVGSFPLLHLILSYCSEVCMESCMI